MPRLRIALLLCLAFRLCAQYPPDTHWRTIRTDHFQILFPQEIENDAQRLANALETLYAPLSQSLGARLPRHTTVLLPNQDVTRYSGGYVSLFPRMAVMQSMPQQGFWGTNDWIATLTATEARHLVQIAKMNHGSGRILFTLFGDSGLATIFGWAMPNWWIDGDARAAQSTYLRGAVGQYASAEMTTRALLLSDEKYSFMKAMHGSLKDGVPSQAELGAFLVNHVTETNGPQAWDKIMARAAQGSWNPFGLSFAMKKETGRSAAANFRDTMSLLDETWTAKAAEMHFTRPTVVNITPKKSFTGYYQPVYDQDGSVLAQRIGLDTWPVEVVRLRPDGREQTVYRYAPSVATSNHTSLAAGKMVWDEYVPDVRWQRGYSEILIRDLAAGRTRRLTHRTRFMNPVLSPDGSRIAVVEFLPDRKVSLVILDAGTGAEQRRLPSPENDMIYMPAWSEDGGRIAMITQSARGRALTIADVESGQFGDVIPHRDEELANPVFYRSWVLYKSSRDGIVDIFAVEISTGQCYRVTASRYGADYPSISRDGTKLVYSDYTARGYNVAEIPLDPLTWKAVDPPKPPAGSHQPPVEDYSSRISDTKYSTEPYRPGLHLFNVHSWGLTSGPPEVGAGVISNDRMGLLDFQASVLYNTDEGTPGFSTDIHYNRFFPVLDFGFTDHERKLQYTDYSVRFNERTATAGFHVPMNFSRGYYVSGVSIGANLEDVSLTGGGLAPLNYGIGIWHVRQRAARDLAPRWGQILRFGYSQTAWADHYSANRMFADGRLALPGLVRHHALVLEGGYERDDGNYTFSRQVSFSRGYTSLTTTQFTKLAGTYSMPLFYPDWALGQLLYVKRVAGNAFYDYGQTSDRLYRSTGVELVFDVNIFHWPGFRIGVRDAYRIDYRDKRINPFIAYGW
jgi:hypothetical protein